jgi:hypothetical protein
MRDGLVLVAFIVAKGRTGIMLPPIVGLTIVGLEIVGLAIVRLKMVGLAM